MWGGHLGTGASSLGFCVLVPAARGLHFEDASKQAQLRDVDFDALTEDVRQVQVMSRGGRAASSGNDERPAKPRDVRQAPSALTLLTCTVLTKAQRLVVCWSGLWCPRCGCCGASVRLQDAAEALHSPLVFSHNDLLAGNLMLEEATGRRTTRPGVKQAHHSPWSHPRQPALVSPQHPLAPPQGLKPPPICVWSAQVFST